MNFFKKIRNKLIRWLSGDMLVMINAEVRVVRGGSAFRLRYDDEILIDNVRSIGHENFAPEVTRFIEKV